MVLSFVIRWCNKTRTAKCLKKLHKRSIDDNLRQLALIRQDAVLVNLSSCFLTSDCYFFFTFAKKWVGRTMGNETFYGDGHTVVKRCMHISAALGQQHTVLTVDQVFYCIVSSLS